MLNWSGRSHTLITQYKDIDPHIILINSHGIPDHGSLKIHGYKTHKKNTTNRHMDGTAILIKSNLYHKIYDDFISDMLAVEVTTETGPIILATVYLPPADLTSLLPISIDFSDSIFRSTL